MLLSELVLESDCPAGVRGAGREWLLKAVQAAASSNQEELCELLLYAARMLSRFSMD